MTMIILFREHIFVIRFVIYNAITAGSDVQGCSRGISAWFILCYNSCQEKHVKFAERSLFMEWEIRKAVKEDETRIKELFIEMLQTIYSDKKVEGYEDGYLDKFFDNHEDWICVAKANGLVVAYLSIEVHHERENYIYLDDLSVSEKYRCKGIGTKLIKTAEKFAKETDISTVVFHVEKSNRLAFKLYERLGYSIMNDEGTRFRMIKRVIEQNRKSEFVVEKDVG